LTEWTGRTGVADAGQDRDARTKTALGTPGSRAGHGELRAAAPPPARLSRRR